MSTQHHLSDCHCPTCRRAASRLEELYPRQRPPRHVLEAWKEKKAKEDAVAMLSGIMPIQCPYCHHTVRVKISPKIRCTACMQWIQ